LVEREKAGSLELSNKVDLLVQQQMPVEASLREIIFCSAVKPKGF